MKQSELGIRMKKYESVVSYRVPFRSYLIIRLDGKGFSKWTKSLDKPFDEGFAEDMVEATKYLCANLQCAVFAYYQSDEISILFTDFEKNEKQQLFEGKINKIVSISTSMLTAKFNQLRQERIYKRLKGSLCLGPQLVNYKPAMFDCRPLVISDPDEVMNYFYWRQSDASRNSVSMASHTAFGPKKNMGKSGAEKQEMLFQEKGINWNDYPVIFKRGVVIRKETYLKNGAERKRWAQDDSPIFNKDWEYLAKLVPLYRSNLFKSEEERELYQKELESK